MDAARGGDTISYRLVGAPAAAAAAAAAADANAAAADANAAAAGCCPGVAI